MEFLFINFYFPCALKTPSFDWLAPLPCCDVTPLLPLSPNRVTCGPPLESVDFRTFGSSLFRIYANHDKIIQFNLFVLNVHARFLYLSLTFFIRMWDCLLCVGVCFYDKNEQKASPTRGSMQEPNRNGSVECVCEMEDPLCVMLCITIFTTPTILIFL